MFRKVLIANRGEIAMRIIRSCRALGLSTVAVHALGEESALHVRFADEAVCIGPPDPQRSYLAVASILAAAEVTGADAIHPGYGFLAENDAFAELCRRCGLGFVGPSPAAMRLWGNKVSARAEAQRFGLPLLPGSAVLRDDAEAAREARRVGFPVILKAAGGGGGRGMRVVREPDELGHSLRTATEEAARAFGNPAIFLERFIERPRHIEFQIVADQHGHAVCLGERECSLQRRHQKVLEEAPSPCLAPEHRARIGRQICDAVQATGYATAATFEFLMDELGELHFLEVNTRIQVEHPVTEAVTGLDLVELQLRAAAGEPLEVAQGGPPAARGHAIECRINAEDPRTFAPWPGLITEYHPPGGAGIRVDSGVFAGWRVPSCYDSLLAKIIAWGIDRPQALARMQVALDELVIDGIRTNTELHRLLLGDPDVRAGRVCTRTIDEIVARST